MIKLKAFLPQSTSHTCSLICLNKTTSRHSDENLNQNNFDDEHNFNIIHDGGKANFLINQKIKRNLPKYVFSGFNLHELLDEEANTAFSISEKIYRSNVESATENKGKSFY